MPAGARWLVATRVEREMAMYSVMTDVTAHLSVSSLLAAVDMADWRPAETARTARIAQLRPHVLQSRVLCRRREGAGRD